MTNLLNYNLKQEAKLSFFLLFHKMTSKSKCFIAILFIRLRLRYNIVGYNLMSKGYNNVLKNLD